MVFADSFFYTALLNPSDQFHAVAKKAMVGQSDDLLTTHWVLIEVADALSWPGFRSHVHRFLGQISAAPKTTVILPDLAWYSLGLALYGNRHDKDWSLTDCISFAIMEHHGITDALTGDHHFTQAGFRALLGP